MYKIRISGKQEETVLSISLKGILMCINNPLIYKWKLLWIEGIGQYEDSILDFEARINNSTNGVLFEYDQLIRLSDSMNQILELTLIGDLEVEKLIRYDRDTEMYENCKFVIELIDSSFWEFSSSDNNDLEIFKQKIEEVFDLE